MDMTKSTSIQPRKQRYARYNAPLHVKRKQMAGHVAESLMVKYNRRSITLVKGDTVKVMRGAFRGHEDKVASVDLKMQKVTIEGVTSVKADGTKVARPVDPSNLLFTRLNLMDPRRRDRLAASAKVDEAARKKLAEELAKEAEAQADEIRKFKERLAAEEAERKAKEREEGDAQAVVDPVTQEPTVVRKPALSEEDIESDEKPEAKPAEKKAEPKPAASKPAEKSGEAKKTESKPADKPNKPKEGST
jgi:large subunit ribosomal protein L24